MGYKRSITLTDDRVDHYKYLDLKPKRNHPSVENSRPRTKNVSNRIIIAAAALTTMVTFGVFITSFWTLVFIKDSHDEICLPKELMKENITYSRKNIKSGELVHCVNTPKKLYSIVNNMAKEYASKDRLSNVLTHGDSISAHVLFSGSNEEDTEKNEVIFNGERSISHFEGFTLGHQRIEVIVTGTYYIYSQVFYQLIPDGPGGVWTTLRDFDLKHEVSLYRTTLPTHKARMELLNNCHLISVGRNTSYYKSIFVAGIFELQSGDEISVSVSYPYYVSRVPEFNFIDILMLG